jgi:hypothetical protein
MTRCCGSLWNSKVFAQPEQAGWHYPSGVRMIPTVRMTAQAIDADARLTIEDDPEEGRRRSPRPPTAADG